MFKPDKRQVIRDVLSPPENAFVGQCFAADLVFLGRVGVVVYFLLGHFPFHFAWQAHYHGVCRNHDVFRYDGPGSDKAIFADNRIVHDYRTHAYDAIVTDGAPVDNRAVPHGDVLSYHGGGIVRHMNDDVVLNVGSFADDDFVMVSSCNDSGPYGDVRTDAYIVKQACVFGDSRGGVDAYSIDGV